MGKKGNANYFLVFFVGRVGGLFVCENNVPNDDEALGKEGKSLSLRNDLCCLGAIALQPFNVKDHATNHTVIELKHLFNTG